MKHLSFVFCLLFCHLCQAQNWSSVSGNNLRNGLSKITGPSSVATVYWNITSSNPTALGANIYSFNDRFVNSRIIFSPVYTAKIECRDIHTGGLLWQSPFISNTAILYACGFDEFAVYAQDYDTDSLYALSPVNGSIIWCCAVTTKSFAPMDGVFFSCENDLIINGPDPVNSTMRVNRITGDTMWSNSNLIGVTPSCVMAANDSVVYRIEGGITSPKQLCAIDVNTGATKYYSAPIPGDGDQEHPLAIGPDGTIYFWRDGGFVYAFRDNGTALIPLWTYTPVSLPFGFVFISIGADGNVLMLDNDKIRRLDHTTGLEMDSSLASFPQAKISVGADSTVYVNDMNNMYYALSHDLQTIKWSLQVNDNYYAGPVLLKDGIFITCGSGTAITAYKDSVSIAPVADFIADTTMVSAGDSIGFTDQSSFSPTSWAWSFPGGNPSSSTLQHPNNIVYPLPGNFEVTLVASNASGSDTLVKKCYIDVIFTSHVLQLMSPDNFFMYPNPADDIIHIRQSEKHTISCFDAMGKLIWERVFPTGDASVDIGGLKEGLYLIRAEHDGSSTTTRLIILR